MPNSSLSASGLSEVLLWRCVSLTPRGINGCWKKIQVQVSKPGLRCEQEVLRTDTALVTGVWCVCVARTSLVVQEGGMERSQAQEETAGLGATQCVYYAALG